MKRRRFLLAGLGLSSALSSGLSSCGWRLSDVRNQAPIVTGKLDNIHLYTWTSYVDEALLKEFQRQTGVKGISDVMASNEEMLAALQAGKGGIYSVICPSDYTVTQMQQKGYLQALDVSRVDGLETLLPNLKAIGTIDNQRYSVPLTWGTTGLLYNSDKLPDGPTDWEYLWKNQAKLTRRMTLLDDEREVFGAVLHSLGFSQNSEDLGQLKQAYTKLQQLKPSLASFTTDAWRDPLVSGDLWVAMCFSTDATELMKDNPQLRYVIPSSGSTLWVDTMVIPVTAPNPESAYEWINYVLNPERSAQLTQTLGYAPVTQAAMDLLPPALRQDPVKFPGPEAIARCEMMKNLSPAASIAIEKYWTQVKT
jgi:spermidine/putrescine transport system substrate-binding protein